MGTGLDGGDEKVTTVRVVLPAFNEAVSLQMLLPALTTSLSEGWMSYHIYVIDDGSDDDTPRIVKKFSKDHVTFLRHKINLGLADAIKTGFNAALTDSANDDIIVTMDADNTHLPGLILRMVRLITEGHDIVISSRYASGARVRGVPFSRRLLSWGASWIFRLLFPIQGVKDYTCGYRAYRVGLLKQAVKKYGKTFIDQKGFSCMVDILLKLRSFDPIAVEVPMILRYDLKPGKSKMDVGGTIMETASLILKRLGSS